MDIGGILAVVVGILLITTFIFFQVVTWRPMPPPNHIEGQDEYVRFPSSLPGLILACGLAATVAGIYALLC
jgi:hypothetical protein